MENFPKTKQILGMELVANIAIRFMVFQNTFASQLIKNRSRKFKVAKFVARYIFAL